MDWNSFALGLIYVYLGLLFVLVLQEQFSMLCRGGMGCELVVSALWPVTLWSALLLWWWQRRCVARAQRWTRL